MKRSANLVSGDNHAEDFNSFQFRLKRMALRAHHLCGRSIDGKPLGEHISNLLMEAHKANTDPELLKERAEYLAKAETDPKLQQELCALRIETISNYALADANWASLWYETIILKDDERFAYQNESVQETRIRMSTDDAATKNEIIVVPSQEEVLIDMLWLVTDEVKIKLKDIYRGDIRESQERILRQSYDWNQEIEERCFNLATSAPSNSGQGGGLFGKFNLGTASKPALELFVPSRRVKRANLPTTNDIPLAGSSNTTKFRWEVFAVAIDYEVRLARTLEGGSPMLTGRIFIPGVDITALADTIVPTGNTNNKVAEDMLVKGWSVIEYLGRTWTLVPDNTIESGACYFEFASKPGRIFLKPGLAEEVSEPQTKTERVNNEQRRWSKQPFGAYINFTRRVHALRVCYSKKNYWPA